MRTSTCLLPKVHFILTLAVALVAGSTTQLMAQDDGVVPASYHSGSFFNKKLGTALRFNYHTNGYGVQEDVVSLGAMKVVPLDGATVFFDGQGTLSDDFGGGFNLGMGYRQLTTLGMDYDPQRVLGAGFWTDGQSTAADNFFTQLGFSLESLGEEYDLRLNGSFPLDRTKSSDPVLSGTGTPFFMGNNLFGATEQVTIDTAHTVVDGEFAKRINDLEAWAFVGGYHLGGGGVDTGGYRIGVRGYAVPDLALSLQVNEDSIYGGNLVFGMTWFVGRTHRGNGPCGNILDRFREPVLRNDFIATTSRRVTNQSGNALTEDGLNETIRIVHVDSTDGGTAVGGADGTFENPFNNLSDAEAAQTDNDFILVHSGSTLTDTITLGEGVRMLGEGRDPNVTGTPVAVVHTVDTNEIGLITFPETAAGASTGVTPTINALAGADSITLGNSSTANNFIVDGGARAVVGNAITPVAAGSTLSNMLLQNQTGNAIDLNGITGSLLVDNSVNVVNAGGAGILVDGGLDGMDINANIVNSAGSALTVQNRTGGTVTFGGTIDDDGGTGITIDSNANSTIALTNASTDVTNGIDINTGGGDAVSVTNNTETTVTFSGTVGVTATGAGVGANNGIVMSGNDANTSLTFNDLDATALDGNAVDIAGAGTATFSSADDTRTIANTGTGNAFFNDGAVASATVTVNSNIENSTGGNSVQIVNRTENDVTFNGTITDDGAGILLNANTGGSNIFAGQVTTNTGTNNGVTVTNANTDAMTTFSGGLDLTTTSGTGFFVDGAGTLTAQPNGTDLNTVNTTTGTGVDIRNTTIGANNVDFASVNTAGSVAGNAINLDTLDGGQVLIGDSAGAAGNGGTVSSTAGNVAVRVNNVENVEINQMVVNNAGGGTGAGLLVAGQQTGSTATFNDLEITTEDENAVEASGNADGTVDFNTLTATTGGAGDGINLNNADGSAVTVTMDNLTVNANGTGRGFHATGGGAINVAGTNTINSAGNTAFSVDNAENLIASNVTIANSTQPGVNVTGLNTNTDTVTLTNFDVATTTADAVTVENNTNGTVNLNNLTAESTTGDTVVLNNNTGATVNLNGMTVEATGSGNAFTATGGGTLAATGINDVTANTGQGVDIQNMTIAGSGATFTSVNVTNGVGNGVNLSTNTGGNIAINGGTMTTSGTGVNVLNSDSVTISNVDINNGTSNGNGVVATNAAGDSLTLTNVDVESGTGAGVDVNGGTFTASGTNTIATTTGTGLDLTNAAISGSANFATVDVNGASNGVILANLTGGQVRVGSAVASGTDGAGGTLTTTGDAISVTGVTNAIFNDIEIDTSGGVGVRVDHNTVTASNVTFDNLALTVSGGVGDGVVVTDNGSGELDFTLRDSTVDVTAVNSIGWNLVTGANTGEIDIRLDGNTITAGNNSAVATDLSSGTGDVQFLVNGGNDWTNNSANATASFLVSTDRTLNATIGDQTGIAPFDENRFVNTTGSAFEMEVNSAAGTASLDLQGNNANGGTNDFQLTETTGNFGVVDRDDTLNGTRNTGTIDLNGGIIGDFDDLGAVKQVD